MDPSEDLPFPYEIFFEIFLSLFLSGHLSDLTRLKGVCRAFHKIIEDVIATHRYVKSNLLKRRAQLTILPDDEDYFDKLIDDLYKDDPMRKFVAGLHEKFPGNDFHFKLLSAYNREIVYAYINTGVLYVQVVAEESGKTLQTFSKSIGKEKTSRVMSVECDKYLGTIRIAVLVNIDDDQHLFYVWSFYSTWEIRFFKLAARVTDNVIMKIMDERVKFFEKNVTFILKIREGTGIPTSFDVDDAKTGQLLKRDEEYSVTDGEYLVEISKIDRHVRESDREKVVCDFKTFRDCLFLVTCVPHTLSNTIYGLEIYEGLFDTDRKKRMLLRATFTALPDVPEFFHDVMRTTMCIDVPGYGKYMFW